MLNRGKRARRAARTVTFSFLCVAAGSGHVSAQQDPPLEQFRERFYFSGGILGSRLPHSDPALLFSSAPLSQGWFVPTKYDVQFPDPPRAPSNPGAGKGGGMGVLGKLLVSPAEAAAPSTPPGQPHAAENDGSANFGVRPSGGAPRDRWRDGGVMREDRVRTARKHPESRPAVMARGKKSRKITAVARRLQPADMYIDHAASLVIEERVSAPKNTRIANVGDGLVASVPYEVFVAEAHARFEQRVLRTDEAAIPEMRVRVAARSSKKKLKEQHSPDFQQLADMQQPVLLNAYNAEQ